MGLRSGLTNTFNSVVGRLPVIGPHAGIEAELMLAGKKPLTWIMVYPDNAQLSDPDQQKEQKKAARKGGPKPG